MELMWLGKYLFPVVVGLGCAVIAAFFVDVAYHNLRNTVSADEE